MEIFLKCNILCIITTMIVDNAYSKGYWEQKASVFQHSNNAKNQCIFPSVHRRKAIYECQHIQVSPPNEEGGNQLTMKIESKWWCPLTDNFDHYPEWQSCPETASTYGGNDPGKQCHFPFVYRKRLYSTCIRAGGSLHYENSNDPVPTDNGESGYWWCSTTPDFDFDGKWTKCRPQLAYQLPCYFSSMLNNVGGLVQHSQHECQPFAGHWICHTELNQIRQCPKTVQNLYNIKTEGGNDPGFPCHFPFQATISLHRDEGQSANIPVRKQNYTRCLPGIGESGSSQRLSIYPTWIGYWCATTDNYDRDKLWTRCNVDLTQPEHLSFIPSNKYVQKFTLSEIWSKLMWLSVLKESEKVKIVLPNQLYGNDFSQSLSQLEYLHASWELLEKRNDQHRLITKEYKTSQEINELNWWTWLAPFWWITYKLNETYSPDSVFRETVIHSKHVSTLNIGNNDKNPLVYGLKLPLWLDDWSESAWDNYALHMKNRWINLIKHLYHKWLQSWLVAFSIGFISAFGIIIFILLVIILLVKKSIRIQMINSVLRSKYQSYDKSDFGEKYKINDTINNNSNNNGTNNDKNIINNVDSQTLCSVNVTNIDGLQKTLHLIPHCHASFNTYNADNIPGCIKQLTLSNTNDTFSTSNSFHQSVKIFKEFESTEHNPDRFLLLSSSPSSSTSLSVCRPIKNSLQSRCCEYSWKMPIYDTTGIADTTATALTSSSNNNFKRNCILDTTNNYYFSSIIKEHIKCILDEIGQSFSNEGKLNDYDVSKCMQNVSRIIDLYLNQHSKYFCNDEKEHIVNALDSHQELVKCCLYTIGDVDHEYTCCCRDYPDHNGRRRLDQPPRSLYCHPHDYSTLSYCDINSSRNSIKNYDNQAEVVEPSAPPPSYDQVVPIL